MSKTRGTGRASAPDKCAVVAPSPGQGARVCRPTAAPAVCDGAQRPQGAHRSRRVARRPDMTCARRARSGQAPEWHPCRHFAGPMARGAVTNGPAAVAEEDEDVLAHTFGRCRCEVCLWEKQPRQAKAPAAAAPPPGAEPVQMLTLPQYREPRCGYVAPAPVRVTARPAPPPPPPRRFDLLALAFFFLLAVIACIAPFGPGPFSRGAAPRGGSCEAQPTMSAGTCDYAPVQAAPAPVAYCDEPVYGTAASGSGAAYQEASSAYASQWDDFNSWSVSQ